MTFAICNLVTSGGVTHYFVFLPKVHIICLLLVVNRGLKTKQEGESSNQVVISRAPVCHLSPSPSHRLDIPLTAGGADRQTNLYVMPDNQQSGEPRSTSNLFEGRLLIHEVPLPVDDEKAQKQQV